MPPFRPMKGRFMNGVWHCNCDPRLPASHFQVKKESANKGRWFYCCTKPNDEQCGFFLWDEDAKVREEGVLLDNTRTESDVMPPPQTPHREEWGVWNGRTPVTPVSMQKPSAQRSPSRNTVNQERTLTSHLTEVRYDHAYESFGGDGADEVFPLYKESELPASPSRKRRRSSTSENEAQKASKLNSPPASHRKAAKNTRDIVDEDDELFGHPSTVRRLEFGTPTVGKPLTANSREQRALTSFADPKPGEAKDFFIPQIGDYPITQTILHQLNEPEIPYATKKKIQQILNTQCLQVSGIEKGRDITRQQLKKKDEKIAELERRIQELEQERELDKTVIRHFKKVMAESVAAK